MEIHQIECFLSVVESGSFRAASERLHKAQSAVSFAIKKLEEEFGFELFDRSSYRPTLTAQGRSLLPQLYNLHQHLSQVEHHAHFLKNGFEPRLRLAVSAILPEEILVSAIQNFTLQFPFTELIIYQQVLSADEMLLSGQVDLAFAEIFDQKDELEKTKIMYVEMVSVCSSSHPLAKFKGKSPKSELLKHRQIVLKSTLENTQRVAGIEPGQPQVGVYNFSLKKQLILCGVGWGGLPWHMIEKEIKKKQVIMTHSQKNQVPIHLAWSKKKILGPCAQFLISSLSIPSKTATS